MPIAIMLRTSLTRSLYRDAIISTIDSGSGNYALLCSGFFQENFNGSLYQASAEPNFSAALNKHLVQLDTLGVHNGSWIGSYRNFCNNLIGHGVNLVPYVMSGLQWHAKVFLLKKNNSHVFGIVGSSNVTANAFGVSNTPPLPTSSPIPPTRFNYECDVYMWDDSNLIISNVMNSLIAQDDIRQQVIFAQYNQLDNIGRSIELRLSEIEDQIWNTGGIKTLF